MSVRQEDRRSVTRTGWANLVYWEPPTLRELVGLEQRYGLRVPTSEDAVKVGLVGACPSCGGTKAGFGVVGMVPNHRHEKRRCPGSGGHFAPASRIAVLQAGRDHYTRLEECREKAGRLIRFPG